MSKNPLNPVLIVDDEENTLFSFENALNSIGIDNTLCCNDGRKVIEILSGQAVELILLDLIMPHITGKELMGRLSDEFAHIPVIVVTGVNDVEMAVSCMKQGAFDYILKPVDFDHLEISVKRALEMQQLKRENVLLSRSVLSDTLEKPEVFDSIITQNSQMKAIFKYCEAVAPGVHPIMITGETGTGKELIARALHQLSEREGEFVAVNAAGLDDNVFADTLFGHIRGAFTGADARRKGMIEKAKSGTLFLDEIGDLNSVSQLKLLRLLDQREYCPLGSDVAIPADARIIVATHKDLKDQMMAEKGFRQDLFYRLHTHHIHLPPLRERKDDIPLLLHYFVTEGSEELGNVPPEVPGDLIEMLMSYEFPGNIRELKSMVIDATRMTKGKLLTLDSFTAKINYLNGQKVDQTGNTELDGSLWIQNISRLPSMHEFPIILIREALRRTGGNQRVAAAMLGITPSALSQRLKKISNH